MTWRKALAFVAGGAAAVALAVLVIETAEPDGDVAPASEPRHSEPDLRDTPAAGPAIDLQVHGPLGYGDRVPLNQAASLTPYPIPIPPTNEITGRRSGVWVGGTPVSLGFVWESDLAFIVHPTNLTVEENLVTWTETLAQGPSRREFLTTVRAGVPALAREPTAATPSVVIWIENGLEMAFYSPTHTVDQLQQLADQLSYGG